MTSNINKIRKLKPFEFFYDVAVKDFNFMIPSYWIKLESSEKLKPADIEKALMTLFKNSDNLSLCLREIEGERWFCRMQESAIDFQVVLNDLSHSVMEEEINKSFNCTDGPLWRAKLVLQEGNEFSNLKNNEQSFTSDMVFSFHHIMMDGFTVLNMCNNFLKILNDILEGSVKDVYDGFGYLDDGSETDNLIQKRLEYFEQNPHIFEEIKLEMKDISELNVVLGQIFPVSDNISKKTKHIIRDLNQDKTSQLINKFKSKGISFHAGFTSVVNWALVEVLIENGCSLESFDIGAFHALNIRRYWKKSSHIQQGCHIGPLRLVVETNKNVRLNFWQYAKNIHNLLKKFLDECRSVDEMLAYPLLSKAGVSYTFEELYNNPPPLCLYYSTTNMGDLSSILQENRKHVNISWLTRTNSCQNMNISMVHVMQTYKGKFLYGLDYATNYVREDLAYMYVDKIFNNIDYLLDNSS